MTRRAAVRETYDAIADHFASTREYAWPEVESFVERIGDERGGASLGLDVGCGNGRHAELLADVCARVVGLDASRGLLETARERARERGTRGLELVQGDASRLPIRAARVDVAVYVATLHHLPSRAARRDSLSELGRVLTADGEALVSVWSTEHDRFDRDTGFDTTVDWTLPGGETVPRYYHIYDPAEFRADLDAAALAVDRTFVSSGNCYAVIRGTRR